MKKTILLFLMCGIIFSCSTTKNASTQKIKPIDLEQFLTLNNDYVKIPITKMPSGHLHLSAVVNGVEGDFILDTGAGATVIETKKKDKFQLKTEQTDITGAGAGGQINLQESSNNKFKIGNLEKQSFSLYIMNLDHVNNAFTSMGLEEVDGVIGADILTSNKGIIDYSKLTLYLKNETTIANKK